MDNKPWWTEWCFNVLHTGSRVICDPPPTDTDDDWMCLVEPKLVSSFEEALASKGFAKGGSLAKKPVKKPNPMDFISSAGFQEALEDYYSNSGKFYYRFKTDDIENQVEPLQEYPDFDLSSNPKKTGIFRSWKGTQEDGTLVNLIITCSDEYFSNFQKATKLATNLNLISKEDRVTLFEAVCHDKWPSDIGKTYKVKLSSNLSILPGAINWTSTSVDGQDLSQN